MKNAGSQRYNFRLTSNLTKGKNVMKIVAVTFKRSPQTYEYRTNLPLKVGARDHIVADDTAYTSSITIQEYRTSPEYKGYLKEIVQADSCD